MPPSSQTARDNDLVVEGRKHAFRDLRTALQRTVSCPLVGVVDIGAGNGLCQYLAYFPAISHLYCFEPDPSQAEILKEQLGREPSQRSTVIQIALADRQSRKPLYVTKSSQNTSLYQPDMEFSSRYRISGLETVNALDTDVHVLDDFHFDHSSMVLKVDAQGGDLDILKGGVNLLRSKVDIIIVETCFKRIYLNQPLFSDIERFLADHGFHFYGQLSESHYSAKLVNRYLVPTRERLVWTDSVFIKDPIENDVNSANEEKTVSFILSLVALEYFDLAFEIANRYVPSISQLLQQFVETHFSINATMLKADFVAASQSIREHNPALVALDFQKKFRYYGVPLYLLKR